MFAGDDVGNVRLSSDVKNGSQYCYGQPKWGHVLEYLYTCSYTCLSEMSQRAASRVPVASL